MMAMRQQQAKIKAKTLIFRENEGGCLGWFFTAIEVDFGGLRLEEEGGFSSDDWSSLTVKIRVEGLLGTLDDTEGSKLEFLESKCCCVVHFYIIIVFIWK